MKRAWIALAGALVLGLAGCNNSAPAESGTTGGTPAPAKEKIKIGFLIKDPKEPWFQTEWKFADEAAAEKGFELVKLPTTSGQEVMGAIDTLNTQGVKGFIICTPDTKLGPAIMAKADGYGMKVLTVDDQFVDGDKPMEAVHHLGIQASNIGKQVGEALAAEMKVRGWKPEETAALGMTYDELETAKQRTMGAKEALVAAGFPAAKVFFAPQKKADIAGATDAANGVLTRQSGVKHWLIFGNNDEAVIGAVRAMEQAKFTAENVVGVGINGSASLEEFKRPEPTGVWGSILLEAKKHGYETAVMMYDWLANGKEPEKATYTTGTLITRENYQEKLKAAGLSE
jgi:L-arabinose transport system substrate-binding protein